VLIDNFLQKATKADKKPHWCVEHQKWEIEPHEKAVMELSKKVGPDPHQAPVDGYPFGGAGFPLPPEDTENIHEPTIPIMLDTERGWNPFKRQQKPNPSTVTPSTPPQKETEGERMDRIITERRKQKGIQQSLLKVMERPDEEDDPYGHKEARRNPASIAQRWEGEAALARMKETGETGGTDRLGPIGRPDADATEDVPPGFREAEAKQRQERKDIDVHYHLSGERMPDAPMPTGNRLNAIENALLKLMKAEPEEDDEASDHDLPERMKGEEHTYGYEEAVGFPVMPTDYIDVADDPEHWRHGSPNVARPKRVNIVDEGSHPAWEGAPEIMTTPKAGREGFPEVAGEPHSDTPGKWPTLTVPWKQAYERDEEPPTPKSYQPKGKPEYMGRGNVKNSIQNSLLKIMKYGSSINPTEVGMTRKNATQDIGKAQGVPGFPRMAPASGPKAGDPEGKAEATETAGSGANPMMSGEYTALGSAHGVADALAGAIAGKKQPPGPSMEDIAEAAGRGAARAFPQQQQQQQESSETGTPPAASKTTLPLGVPDAPTPSSEGTNQSTIPKPNKLPVPGGTLTASMKKAFGIRSK